MFKLTKLITFAPGAPEPARADAADRLTRAGAAIPALTRALLRPTLPGVYNGGDLIWHLQFADESAWRAALADRAWSETVEPILKDGTLIAHIDGVAYEGGPSGTKEHLPGGVYRTLLLSVNRAADPEAIARFETETFAMGRYIGTIRNWQVSRVIEAAGARPWTHVWEQEYADLGGLMGAYMLHPYHWGHIDRWFDPECTDFMIDTHLCHTFCAFDGAVIRAV
jgi:hypothetical protein